MQLQITVFLAVALAWSAPLLAGTMLPSQGASSAAPRAVAASGAEQDCEALSATDNTKLGMIRQLQQSGKPHAAIAHLDAARLAGPQADLLRADGLRQTGREDQAVRYYRQLLDSCVAGYAYQGLGLIESRNGNVTQALAYLHSASQALPVDASIRSDHGYALMLAGQDDLALHEFLTAIELSPGHRRAAHNLILLLARSGDEARLKLFADKFGISRQELASLQELASQPLQRLPQVLPAPAHADAGRSNKEETTQ